MGLCCSKKPRNFNEEILLSDDYKELDIDKNEDKYINKEDV